MVHDSVPILDKDGLMFEYEIQYEMTLNGRKEESQKQLIHKEIRTLLRTNLGTHEIEDICIFKKDSIESYTINAVNESIESNAFTISNFEIVSIKLPKRLYDYFENRYGELNETQKIE